MKSATLSLLLFLAIINSVHSFTGTITASCNLRSSPSTSANKLKVLFAGTKITYASVSGGWAKVTAPISGNVSNRYVKADMVVQKQKKTTPTQTVVKTTTTTSSTGNLSAMQLMEQSMKAKQPFNGFGPAAKRGTHATLNAAGVRSYAERHWDTTKGLNHDCSQSATDCTPYTYFGDTGCKQKSLGGDCANFVSQCIIAGGHEKLEKSPCRGREFCGAEPGCPKLIQCLESGYGWAITSCEKAKRPPQNLKVGDIVFGRANSCEDEPEHSVVVTRVEKDGVFVSSHSVDLFDHPIDKFLNANLGYIQYAMF